MANKINNLLSKSGWSGEEIGRAAVKHVIEEYISFKDPEYKTSLSIQDIERLRDSIKNDYDAKVYNRYIGIVNLISEAMNLSQSYIQQFHNGYFRLIANLNIATLAATTYKELAYMPMIMTQAKYDEYYANAQKELSEIGETPAGLFFHAISYFGGSYGGIDEAPAMPKEIEEIAEKMKTMPFTNAELYAQLAEAAGIGYHVFEDGTRSDELSEQEYEKKLIATNKDFAMLGLKEGSEEFYEEFFQVLEKQYRKRKAGMSVYEIERAPVNSVQWIKNTDMPETLTQWDIIFGEFCEATAEVFYYNWGEDLEKGFDSFKKEFPELSEAVIKYLSKTNKKIAALFTGKHGASEELITWGELAALNVLNYSDMIIPGEDSIRDQYNESRPDNERTASFSIAIIKEGRFANSFVENNEFKNPIFDAKARLTNQLNEPISDDFRTMLIEPALKQLYAFHFILTTVGEIYDFPEISNIAPNITEFEEKIMGANALITLLYNAVKNDEKKSEVVIDGAQLIDLNELRIPEENKAKALDKLRASSAYGSKVKIDNQTLRELLDILYSDREGAAEND